MGSRFCRMIQGALAVLVGVSGTMRAEVPEIRLALLITVDQLRGDVPQRFRDRFGENGFRRLMDGGAHYTNAFYQHANTFTAVGHATLFTGGHTAQHGLPGNDWYDYRTREQVYCVEDERHELLGEATQAHDGTSPRNLTASTVGDELMAAGNGRSKVFGLSLKDRGAIIPAGRMGKAFWYSKRTGRFLTSTYYHDETPSWLEAWNQAHSSIRYSGGYWTLHQDEADYLQPDRREAERPFEGLGGEFPHPLGDAADSTFHSRLRYTPFADRMLLELAKEVIGREQLGQRGATDMLALSFSATDHIGHAFGPASREAEDNLICLDETLAELFAYVDRQVGLDRTLIVLTSDHGIAESPEHRSALKFAAGRVDIPGAIDRVNAALRQRFGVGGDLVQVFWNPGIYLDRDLIETLGLNLAEVEQAAGAAFEQIDGIARALQRRQLQRPMPVEDAILALVRKGFHPQRSGDILLVQEPFWYLHPKPEKYAAMHGSPYNYDRHVPILIAGPGIEPQRLHRRVAPADIAITLSTILGLQVPSGSVGQPLVEVIP